MKSKEIFNVIYQSSRIDSEFKELVKYTKDQIISIVNRNISNNIGEYDLYFIYKELIEQLMMDIQLKCTLEELVKVNNE